MKTFYLPISWGFSTFTDSRIIPLALYNYLHELVFNSFKRDVNPVIDLKLIHLGNQLTYKKRTKLKAFILS